MKPTLPLSPEGALLFDNSFFDQQACPAALELSQINKRQLNHVRDGINFGSAIHLALEYRYKTFGADLPDPSLCFAKQCEIMSEHFAKNPPSEGNFRNLNWACEVIQHYNERYALEDFNVIKIDDKPFVEQPFCIPFAAIEFCGSDGYIVDPNKDSIIGCQFTLRRINTLADLWEGEHPMCYTGKIDLGIDKRNKLWTKDHKTSSSMGQSFWDEYRVSPQQWGYAWAFWKTTKVMPHGFIVNGIRTGPMPVKPKNGIAAWWEETFQRNEEILSDWHLPEWEKNTLALIDEFLYYATRGYFPMKRKMCVGKYGKCQFYELHNLPPEQRWEELESEKFMDNNWSPLNKENL